MFSDSSVHNRVTELQQRRFEGVRVRAVSPSSSSMLTNSPRESRFITENTEIVL